MVAAVASDVRLEAELGTSDAIGCPMRHFPIALLPTIILATLAAAWSVGCHSNENRSENSNEPTSTEALGASPAAANLPSAQPEKAGQAAPAKGTVEVAPGGTKFDPPVKVSQIPVGAWMCDMGTVHYAAREKGDGQCPICGMKLKQKTLAQSHGVFLPNGSHGGPVVARQTAR